MPGTLLPQFPLTTTTPRVLSGRDLVRVNGAKRPAPVSLRDALARVRAMQAKRRIRSATGATITLLGDHNAYAVANQPQIADFTLGWGEQVGFDCSNLTPNEANLNWILFPPDGSALVNKATVGTDAVGNCQSPIQDITLATPYGVGTDTPYAGVWAVGLRKANGDYEAVTYFVVSSEPALLTYDSGSLNHATRDFTSGQTMYVVANNLNPSDSYAIGWVQTSLSPIKCVHAVPAQFAALPNCFAQSVANGGVQAASGSFEATWDTSAAPVPASGAYTVQLYDVTQHRLVAAQQVALQSSGITWSLTPYQGATSGSTGLTDFTYAFDGFLDQAVTGLTYGVTGAGVNGALRLTVSDPNGAVLTSGVSADAKHAATPVSVAVAGGSGTSGRVPFALNAAMNAAVGPTSTFNASNTMLAQLYDPLGGTVVATKSFTLLAYGASLNWNGVITASAPGNSCQLSGLTAVTVTNTAVATYGPNNGDGIVGIKINGDAGGNITVCSGDATATDPNGNTWNVTYAGGSATATIAAAKPAALLPGQSLTFSIIMAGPSSVCGGPPCSLQTQILPLHGLAYSANNTASNGLIVGGKNNTSVPSDYGWTVTTPGPGNGIAAPPSFTQMLYTAGTNGTTTGTNFSYVKATIQNNNPAGTSNDLNDVLFTFPSNYDFTSTGSAPALVSLTTQGGTPIAGWSVVTKNGTSNNVPGPSSFALANGTSNSTSPLNPITPGTTVIATLKIPMPPISFALQQIPATANFDGGCITVTGTKCTYASTALVSTGTNQNTVAGPTNVDSTEFAVYSLNTTKMSGTFTPQTIGAGVATTTTFNFTNTPTSADPNPDWIDQINLTFPTGAQPSSVTAPAGWTVTNPSTGVWSVALNACSPAPCQETGAVAPGGALALTVAFANNTAAGTYDGVGADPPAVSWTVRGANGGTTTTNSTAYTGKSKLVVSPVSASVSFAGVGGYPTATTVLSGTEPTVGSDTDVTNGNAYDYKLTNNGSVTITNATITIPVYNRASALGTDTAGQNWQIVGTPAAPGCSVAVTAVTTGATPANGSIALSGCSIAPGASLDVKFNAKEPYQIGSEFDWPATVCANPAQCATLSVGATPAWPTAEYIKIVVDARLSIVFSNGTPIVGSAPALPNPGPGGSGPGGSTPTTVCPGCTISSLGATPVLDLAAFAGVAQFSDVIDAAVTSDVVGPDAWSLYVSIDANPLNGSAAKEFSMKIDSSVMVPLTGLTVPAAVTSFFQPNATGSGVYPTASSGTLLSTYNGSAHRTPIDTIHSFKIDNTGAVGTQAVTVMWTLIPS
ncbi:MAG TPA: hypothetical protein VGC72_07510 [Candidatus Elarobacter sp.]